MTEIISSFRNKVVLFLEIKSYTALSNDHVSFLYFSLKYNVIDPVGIENCVCKKYFSSSRKQFTKFWTSRIFAPFELMKQKSKTYYFKQLVNIFEELVIKNNKSGNFFQVTLVLYSLVLNRTYISNGKLSFFSFLIMEACQNLIGLIL